MTRQRLRSPSTASIDSRQIGHRDPVDIERGERVEDRVRHQLAGGGERRSGRVQAGDVGLDAVAESAAGHRIVVDLDDVFFDLPLDGLVRLVAVIPVVSGLSVVTLGLDRLVVAFGIVGGAAVIGRVIT